MICKIFLYVIDIEDKTTMPIYSIVKKKLAKLSKTIRQGDRESQNKDIKKKAEFLFVTLEALNYLSV